MVGLGALPLVPPSLIKPTCQSPTYSRLPATSLSACGAWHTDGGKVTQSTTGVVAAMLGLGFIPVLHGDGVLDDVKVGGF